MKRALSCAAILLLVPSVVAAHVGVRPRESKPGGEERYTVRVPTEGTVNTTSVRLEVPEGVAVLEVTPDAGATFTTPKDGGRIVAIVWTRTIPAKEMAEFAFRARNPEGAAQIIWKAHQHFADGTVTDWIGPAGTARPAPITALTAAAAAVPAQGSPREESIAIEAWLKSYDAAFVAKDLDKLATFYHPDVTIYEGGGINNGWADYRDRHLGPELKAFENVQFAHGEAKVTMLAGGQSAYATSRYTLEAKMGERDIDSEGLATYLLIKAADGAWKIRHSHTSSRPARKPDA